MLTHNGRGFHTYRAITERSSLGAASNDSNVLSHDFLVLSLLSQSYEIKQLTRELTRAEHKAFKPKVSHKHESYAVEASTLNEFLCAP